MFDKLAASSIVFFFFIVTVYQITFKKIYEISDYTLWPFWVDTHVNPPFRKGFVCILI